MKLKNIQILIALIITAVIFGSCVKQDFKKPDQIIPSAPFTANTSIATFKTRHTIAGKLDSIVGDTIINGVWCGSIISGVVVGNDESGNIYKAMYIQDSTGGIMIPIDKTSIYNEYKLGQKVAIECLDLVLGDYSGLPQLGTPYLNGAMWQVGRIADVYLKRHFHKDGLPGVIPEPREIIAFNQIMSRDYNTLVKLKNVSFADADLPYAETTATTSRNITDSLGATVVVRTSNYANFATEILPMGKCDITGIMGHYGTDNQFIIRDLKDIKMTVPYLLQEGFSSSLGSFTQFSVQGNQIWVQALHSGKTYANMSGYSGGYFANEDWLISPSINMDKNTGEKMKFETAMNYGTAGDGTLKLYYSSNYVSGSPTAANWTEITGVALSAGAWAWTQSGTIDLNNVTGSNVHFAFKYKCTTSGVPTWEIDNVIIWRNN